jgi:hypothetical protein
VWLLELLEGLRLERYSARQLRSPVITHRPPFMWSLNRSTSRRPLAIGPTAGRCGMTGGVYGCALEFKYVISSLIPSKRVFERRRAHTPTPANPMTHPTRTLSATLRPMFA